jgi:hypothetical protein
MMVALCALTISPSGRVLSVDSWVRARGGRRGSVLDIHAASEFAGWPIKLLQWFYALMYISAVYAKLSTPGWANGYTLQFYLAADGLLWDSPLALWASQFHWMVLFAQYGVLLFQATFSLAIVFPVLRWVYVPAGLALHVGIYLTLKAEFFSWIGLYAVFIPWAAAARLLRSRSGGTGPTPVPAPQGGT